MVILQSIPQSKNHGNRNQDEEYDWTEKEWIDNMDTKTPNGLNKIAGQTEVETTKPPTNKRHIVWQKVSCKTEAKIDGDYQIDTTPASEPDEDTDHLEKHTGSREGLLGQIERLCITGKTDHSERHAGNEDFSSLLDQIQRLCIEGKAPIHKP